MKKIIVVFAMLAFLAPSLLAQKYVPVDTWPYVFEEFVPGTVVTSSGTSAAQYLYNVSVLDGSLHYIKDDVIMKAEMVNVRKANIGEDIYVNIAGQMYKIISETADGSVLEQMMFNPDAQEKSSIGYGVSSSVANTKSSTNIMGARSETMNKSVMDAQADKFGGKPIAVNVKNYLYVSGKLFQASRYEMIQAGVDKAALDGFIKANKIKWKQTESLEQLVSFLKTQIQ